MWWYILRNKEIFDKCYYMYLSHRQPQAAGIDYINSFSKRLNEYAACPSKVSFNFKKL